MSRSLRDIAALPDFQTGYLGYYADHILSVGGLLVPYAALYPSGYLEIEYVDTPVGFTGNLDGSYTYAGSPDTVTFNLYVNDAYIDQYVVNVGSSYQPGRRRHRSGSGGIGAVSGGSGHGVVS